MVKNCNMGYNYVTGLGPKLVSSFSQHVGETKYKIAYVLYILITVPEHTVQGVTSSVTGFSGAVVLVLVGVASPPRPALLHHCADLWCAGCLQTQQRPQVTRQTNCQGWHTPHTGR